MDEPPPKFVRRAKKGELIPARVVPVLVEADMGSEILIRLEESGMTFTDVAAIAGVSVHDVWLATQAGRGRRNIPFAAMQSIINVLGGMVNIQWFSTYKPGRQGLTASAEWDRDKFRASAEKSGWLPSTPPIPAPSAIPSSVAGPPLPFTRQGVDEAGPEGADATGDGDAVD